MRKEWLSPKEAVAEGLLPSLKTAANMRAMKMGPVYHKPAGKGRGGRVYYRRVDLETWLAYGRVLTEESLTLEHRTGTGD